MSVARMGAAASERGDTLESDIRNSVHRDAKNGRPALADESEKVTNNLGVTLERVSTLSLSGIDELVAELQTLRERLAYEGERVQRELAEYAFLSQSSIQSTKVVAESLEQFKHAFELPERG